MRPLVPVLLAFISGIIIEARSGLSFETVYICLAVSFMPLVFSYFLARRFNYYSAALPFVFLGALFILPYMRPELPPGHIRNFIESNPSAALKHAGEFGPLGTAVEGEVLRSPDFANGRTRLYIGAERIFKDNGWRNTGGTILLTVEGEDERFNRGDRVRFIARLKEPMNFGNPGEFDLKGSLNRRGIFVTGYVKSQRLMEKIGEEDPADISKLSAAA